MAEPPVTSLQEYERLKFELGDVIRSAQLVASGSDDDADRWRDLQTRLAEDRFTVVVAGRFSRGKSTLMNALLGLDRLPTGVVPLTSVITYVRYGTHERVMLDYLGSRLHGEARLEDLAEYVTERGNPGNVKRLRSAEIQLPAEILRRGFFFVDTPGLGSAILENTETTERFIPEIDMLILVTGFESPLSEDELRFLLRASGTVRAVFIVVNKQDMIPPPARSEVLGYVEARVRAALGTRAFRLFSVSAKDGLHAKQSSDSDALRASGIHELEAELVRLLARERSRLFLSSMCDRIRASLDLLPDQHGDELRAKMQTVAERVNARAERDGLGAKGALPPAHEQELAARYPGACEVCTAVLDEQFRFLARYQFELSSRASARQEHAARGGFCPFHTWHYERITSPRAVCSAYPPLLARTAELLSRAAGECQGAAADAAWPLPQCPVCELRRATEDRAIGMIVVRERESGTDWQRPRAGLCLPHLRMVVDRSDDHGVRQHLLSREAVWLERIAEDMQRYAVKHDGLRRSLASDEERDAPRHALQVLAGHTNVNAIGGRDEL